MAQFTNLDLRFTIYTTVMAIKLAGMKTAKPSEIKIENQSTIDLPKNTLENIKNATAFLPIEHLRGLERVRLVDFIKVPQMKTEVPIKGDLPGLYHPKVGNQNAWLEISIGALLQPTEKFMTRWMAKTSFKSNLSGLIFSLVGQHYYFTLKHSVKKQNLEPQVRQYAQKNLRDWSEKQNENSFRAKLFKPLRPMIERWAKWLNKKQAKAKKN
ncbi:MAG TPA: hypothetical protein PKE69_15705 [Pyrinomonadaceae bacterium]|nr:hypothetical protein [Pyrinomonadaceae bacterium]